MGIRFKVAKKGETHADGSKILIDHAIADGKDGQGEHLLLRQRHPRKNTIVWWGCSTCGTEGVVSDNTNGLAEEHAKATPGRGEVEAQKDAHLPVWPGMGDFFASDDDRVEWMMENPVEKCGTAAE